MIRRVVLTIALLAALATSASAQLFGGIVYDPTNYANAVLRYGQLQQQLGDARVHIVQRQPLDGVGRPAHQGDQLADHVQREVGVRAQEVAHVGAGGTGRQPQPPAARG